MKKITFNNIFNSGHIKLENNLYTHVHNPEMLLQYDSNFIKFKKMPTTVEFIEAQNYLRAFHEKYGQNHVRFYFPEGRALTPDLTDYFKNEGYAIGSLELFAIQPSHFPAVKIDPDIVVQKVSSETIDSFLSFQYEQDCVFGKAFAEQKQAQHLRNFMNEKIMQLIAFYKGNLSGSVDIIISEDTAEIDGLIVHDDYQKKGIGSRLQQFVMDHFHDKTVILVAEGEDTPKDMYKKQNYQYIGFQYETLKVYPF